MSASKKVIIVSLITILIVVLVAIILNQNTTTKNTVISNQTLLPNEFNYKDGRYAIKYPANWTYEQPNKGSGTVIFSGKKDTPSYFSTVNIQVVLTKKTGGKYNNVEELMNSLKKDALKQAKEVKFLSENAINHPEPGRYFVMSYTYEGQKFKQMQFVFERADGKVFYTYGYTAPADRYEADLSIAKAMFATWTIY